MKNKSQVITVLTFLVMLIVACIVVVPLAPKTYLTGLQSINLEMSYLISNYVGGIGFCVLFVGLGSLLGILMRCMFLLVSSRSVLSLNRTDLIISVVSTIGGLLLITWYMWSYLHSPEI